MSFEVDIVKERHRVVIRGGLPLGLADRLLKALVPSRKAVVALDCATLLSRDGRPVTLALASSQAEADAWAAELRAAPVTLPAAQRALPADAQEWLRTGERGISSETMFEAAFGVRVLAREWHASAPQDPADLRRCMLLVDAVPAVREAFPRIEALSVEWAAIIAAWDRLTALLREEMAAGDTAPRTWALMREIRGESPTRRWSTRSESS